MKSKISIILVIFLSLSLFAQSDLKVISSDRNSLIVEFTPDYSDSSIVIINGQQYLNVGLVNGYISTMSNFGMPAVPERLFSIGVPSEFGNTIQIISSSFKEISGRIIPVPTISKPTNLNYKFSEKYNQFSNPVDLVTFGTFGLSRDLPIQKLVISPVKFYPLQNKIQVYTKIVFKVNFANSQSISSKPASNLLDGAIVNYKSAKYWSNSKQSFRKAVSSSVLATGTWIRFETPEEGIYKISKTTLASFGIDPNNIDPRTLKIYNNGGKVLAEDLNTTRPSDLVENAITVVGEVDGKFDDGDYILFYGRGNDFWDYDSQSGTIKRYFHPYSNKNYYWITFGGNPGKRITDKSSLNQSTKYLQATSKAFANWEIDKKNIGQTGRQYAGDAFSQATSSISYANKLDGRIQGSKINYKIRFINASSDNAGLQVTENGNLILNQYVYGYGGFSYILGMGYDYNTFYSGNLADNRSILNFTVSPSSPTTVCYLDYFEIQYSRDLTAADDNLLFFSKDTTATIEYDLGGFSNTNIMVFDVSDYANVKYITNPILQSGSNFNFQVNETGGDVSKYFAVGNDNFKTPVNPETISNSNLHGISDGAKFIIITNKLFEVAANKLKNYRSTQSILPISTIVVDVDRIFNEFSCGMVDVSAIRDFIKYAYDNWQIKPEYVLFFGKGTYDYKNVEGFNNNLVPPYETQESLNEIPSYTSDDFFVKISGNDNFVDLASGRITVESEQEANDVIDKIIQYENNSDKGNWRNLITLVADDGYTGASSYYEGPDHTAASETLANSFIPQSFDVKKIYMAAYPPEITGVGRRMPTVNTAIIDAINEGTLILNYVGHGSPSQWAQEDVFDQVTTIPQLHNSRYFFLTAATCDFGYFDKTDAQSSAEDLLLRNNSGCIASFTASRLVYSSLNHALMYQYFQDLLTSQRDTLNLNIPIGKAIFITKQTYNGINDQKYHIIGDPTLRLLVPEYSAKINSVNGQQVTTSSPDVQIKALSKANVSGVVTKTDGTTWNDFSGEGILTMFDSQRIVPLPAIGNYPVTLQGGVIFRGRISISSGNYSTNFVVPKDISYENKNGKIILYFLGNNTDGIGFTNKIIVGGTDTTTTNDGKGPLIEVYFDDSSYRNSLLVNPDTKLIVKLTDETGLNTTGTGVGHKFVGILNGQENDPIDFTNYFTSDLNSGGKSGEINYPFTNLASGNYNLEIKAWDVFNNYSSTEAAFEVVSDSSLVIKDVYNYPNPFTSNTTFTFQQNLNKLLDLKIKIYTVAGRLIKHIEKYGVNDKFVKVNWDGRDQDGSQIANGTYLYKIIVRTTDGSYNKSVLGKLAIIR